MTPAERLAALHAGADPALIVRLPSGFVTLGASQYLPGYCLLLADPLVGQLNDLDGEQRAQFLADMARIGDAVKAVTGCKRINYGIYGNVDPFLHVHVFPRYEWEPADSATLPPLSIPASLREAPEHRFDPSRHDSLVNDLRQRLTRT